MSAHRRRKEKGEEKGGSHFPLFFFSSRFGVGEERRKRELASHSLSVFTVPVDRVIHRDEREKGGEKKKEERKKRKKRKEAVLLLSRSRHLFGGLNLTPPQRRRRGKKQKKEEKKKKPTFPAQWNTRANS